MRRLVGYGLELLAYRGGQGHWAHILHRLTGVGVLVFLVMHVVDTALIGWGPDVFNKVMSIYRHPFFRVNEVFLFAAVLFHALNGFRVVLVDVLPGATRHHKKMLVIEVVLFFAVMIPAAYIMWKPLFGGAHG